MDIILKNAMIVTMDENRSIIRCGSLAVRGERIAAIGNNDEVEKQNPDIQNICDCSGRVIFPGFINIHTHAALSIIRGVAEDMGTAPAYTSSVPQGEQLSEYESSVLAALGAAEALRFGSTLIADNYVYSCSSAKVFSGLGMRAVVSERIHDIEFYGLPLGRYEQNEKMGDLLLQKNVDLIEAWDGKDNGRIRCCFGPHAPDTCTPGYLRKIADLAAAKKTGLATHLSQSKSEQKNIEKLYHKTSTQYLYDCGILNSSLVAAHGIFVTEDDIRLLSENRVTIAHAAEGNAKGGMTAPVMKMKKAGVNIGIATDNGSADMIETMRMALCSARMLSGSCVSPQPVELLEMATINGAKALGLEREIGSLEVGKKADIVVLDYRKPHLCPCINAVGNLLHTALGSDVEMVLVDGNIVVKDGRVMTTDMKALLQEAQEIAVRHWYEQNTSLDERLTMREDIYENFDY